MFIGRFVAQKFMLSSSFRYGQINNSHRYDLGHTLLCYLSPTYMFNKPTPCPKCLQLLTAETGLLNKSSCLAPAPYLAKFLIDKDMILATLLCYFSWTWMFNKTNSEVILLNTKLMLSSSLMCDQIYECPRYDVGYALLYYLSQTWMFQLTYLCIVMKENHQAMLIGL
jgi:hypothetical protein